MKSASSHPESSNIGYQLPIFMVIVAALTLSAAWQYRSVLMELHQFAASDFYQALANVETEAKDDAVYGMSVALIRSDYTLRLAGQNAQSYNGNIKAWEHMLTRNQFDYKVLDGVPDLEDAHAFNLMVLPATSSVSLRETRAVKSFLKSGRGVVMTWGCGTKNEFGQWKKYSLLQEVAGIQPNGLPTRLAGDRSEIKMLKQQTLSSMVPSGLSMAMSRYDQPMCGWVLEERTSIDGLWSSGAAGTSADLFSGSRKNAAIAHGEYLGGRFVWTGFTLNSSLAQVEQANAMQATLRESMLWASRQIRLVKPTWPGGQPSALSITQNLRVVGGVDRELIEVARSHGVPVTSFVGHEIIEDVPQVLHQLDGAGEVGILIDSTNKSETNLKSLRKMRAVVKQVIGKAPEGCRVQGDLSSDLALSLVKAGFVYVSSASYDRLVPRVLRSYRPVEVLSRPRYLWLVPEMPCGGLEDGDEAHLSRMFAYISEARALGGYCCLSFEQHELDAGVPARLSELLTRAREEQMWMTTTREITQTWSWWDNIKISTKPISANLASIQVSNTGLVKAPGIDLELKVSTAAKEVDVEAMMLGVDLPRMATVDGKNWTMHLNDLRAGKNIAYKIEFKDHTL